MKILLRRIEKKDYTPDIKSYLKEGGYQALKKVLGMSSEEIIEEVKASKLIGRGGAGFPTGLKWEFTYKAKGSPKYVVCNADEGEPCTFKDRVFIEKDPHLLLEGMIICGFAIKAKEGFIYIRGEYVKGYESLVRAIEEAEKAGFLGDNICGSNFSFRINVYKGAGAYICGEETALLESLEGKRGQPRLKPPFPTNAGFRSKPTTLNNVETFCNIPEIILKGGEYYSKIGSSRCPGTKIYCLSGDINRPGVYELPMDITLGELLEKYGGGVRGELKAVIPGGISSSLLTDKDLDVIMDYPGVRDAGSMLGSGAVTVMNKDRCMVDIAKKSTEFFEHESCGQCTPCRHGTKMAKKILTKITEGNGSLQELEFLKEFQKVMFSCSYCPLGQAALSLTCSAIEKFYEEFYEHVTKKICRTNVCPLNANKEAKCA